jgi:hypothetical protein
MLISMCFGSVLLTNTTLGDFFLQNYKQVLQIQLVYQLQLEQFEAFTGFMAANFIY